MMPIIYLGTHQVCWLKRLTHPLFISRRRLEPLKKMPRALGPWALDSGGFSEISMFGEWRTKPATYVAEVRRFKEEIGNLQWAAIQDWMCEPSMLAKTGLTIEEHQRRTVDSYDELLDLDPTLPWAPVLQGWCGSDYMRHVEMYQARGHDLRELRTVGIGSVCRRQATGEAELIIRGLNRLGIRLHGFGFKMQGLVRAWDALVSSDSMAWSFDARHRPPLPECRGSHANCANCHRWALNWLGDVTAKVAAARYQHDVQGCLFAPREFT